MKQQFNLAARAFLILAASFFSQAFSHPSGGDYYKVLLNNKLITEQYLTKPVAMKTVSLTTLNNNDILTIYYSHCGSVGKERSVSLKNQSGKVLKEWKFADSKSMDMVVPVKEVLNASGKNTLASFYYASKEIPSGKQLITIALGNTATAKL